MTHKEAVDLLQDPDLIGIGMAADAVRRRLHPEGIVTYIIDRNINYTNFCTEYCTFCAFYRPMGHSEGYILTQEEIFGKIQETIDLGGTGMTALVLVIALNPTFWNSPVQPLRPMPAVRSERPAGAPRRPDSSTR